MIGSGRTELLRAIFGADKPDRGRLGIGPESRTVQFASPAEAVRHGIGLVPEDRKRQGLLLSQSIVTNTTLATLAQFSQFPGRIDRHREVLATSELGSKLSIDYNGPQQPVGELSGGNQQKVTIARWLLRDCTVLLLDEPSRGVDVAARNAIHQLLRELASAGKAVVVVSSETEELMALCDRIAVMSRGRIAAEFDAGEWTDQLLMAAQLSSENRVTEGAVA